MANITVSTGENLIQTTGNPVRVHLVIPFDPTTIQILPSDATRATAHQLSTNTVTLFVSSAPPVVLASLPAALAIRLRSWVVPRDLMWVVPPRRSQR